MKTKTITKFVSDDGKEHDTVENARAADIANVAKRMTKDGERLTTASLIEMMAHHPGEFIDVLKEEAD